MDNLETQYHWWPVLSSTAQKVEDTRDPRKAAVPDPKYLGREGSALSIVGLFCSSVDWMRLTHSRKGIHFALSTNGQANLTLNTLTDKPEVALDQIYGPTSILIRRQSIIFVLVDTEKSTTTEAREKHLFSSSVLRMCRWSMF